MSINPIFDKELRRQSREPKLSMMILLSNILLTSIFFLSYFHEPAGEGYIFASNLDMPVRSFTILGYVLFGIMAIISLVAGGAAISTESEQRTLDILLMTNMSPKKIVYGKMMTVLGGVVLLFVSTLPSMSLVMVLGGISFLNILVMEVTLLFSSFFIAGIGIFCSAMFKKTVASVIATFMIVLFLIVGTTLLVVAGASLSGSSYDAALVRDMTDSAGGIYIYLFLLNPLTVYVGVVGSQVGMGKEIMVICSQFGNYENNFVVRHMSLFAALVQAVLTFWLLAAAARSIDPLRKH